MPLIRVLKVGNIREMSLSQTTELAESDFLKHWIKALQKFNHLSNMMSPL